MNGLRVPELSDDETITLNILLEQLRKKEPRNRLRSASYDGKQAVKQVGTVIPAQYRRLAMALGWTAKGVDGLARRCNIDKFVWADGDLDSLGMQGLVDDNFLLSELAQGRTDSLIHGVSFLITTQGLDGEPDVLIHAKDGRNATGQYNARRRALDSLLSITERDGSEVTGFVLYLDNVTINAQRVDGAWQVDRSEHAWHVPAEPVVYRPRTSRRFGRSRITRPALSHQMSALRALVRLEAHMDIYAIPKLLVLGAGDDIFKNADGSPKDSWQVVMGRVFGIPDDDEAANPRADVKQFSAESPAPHLSQLNALAKLEAREFDLPDTDFALTDVANPTSADSYTASRENLIAEAEGFMGDIDAPVRRTVMRALAMRNGLSEVPKEWSGIQPKWRSPIYLSKAQQADAGVKILSAMPDLANTEVGMELAGLDTQQIQRAQAEIKRNAGRNVLAAIVDRNANGA